MPTYVDASMAGAVTASDCVPSLPAGTLTGDLLVLFVFTTDANAPTVEVNGWTLAATGDHPFNTDQAVSIFTGPAGSVGAYTATTHMTLLVAVRDGTPSLVNTGAPGWWEQPSVVPTVSVPHDPAGLVVGAFFRRNTGNLTLTAENDGVHRGFYPDLGLGNNRGAWWTIETNGGPLNATSPAYSHGATPNTPFNAQGVRGWVRVVPARRRGGRHLGLVRGSRGVG